MHENYYFSGVMNETICVPKISAAYSWGMAFYLHTPCGDVDLKRNNSDIQGKINNSHYAVDGVT